MNDVDDEAVAARQIEHALGLRSRYPMPNPPRNAASEPGSYEGANLSRDRLRRVNRRSQLSAGRDASLLAICVRSAAALPG